MFVSVGVRSFGQCMLEEIDERRREETGVIERKDDGLIYQASY